MTEPRTIVARYVRALQEGDLDTCRASFHPDAVWYIPGDGPLSGDYVGPDGIFGDFFTRAMARFDATVPTKLELDRIVADGPHVVAQWRTTGRTVNGTGYDNSYAIAFEIRAGLIRSAREYLDTKHFDEALFG